MSVSNSTGFCGAFDIVPVGRIRGIHLDRINIRIEVLDTTERILTAKLIEKACGLCAAHSVAVAGSVCVAECTQVHFHHVEIICIVVIRGGIKACACAPDVPAPEDFIRIVLNSHYGISAGAGGLNIDIAVVIKGS